MKPNDPKKHHCEGKANGIEQDYVRSEQERRNEQPA
jgi:hypothetical protein